MSIQIEARRQDSELQTRLLTLTVKDKRVITPRRSLCLTKDAHSESKVITNPKVRGINEVPRRIAKEKLLDIDSDLKKQEDFYYDIASRFRTFIPDEINLFVYTYDNGDRKRGVPNKTPTETETEYLCGLLEHPFNDVWIPPVVPGLSGSDYVPYLEKFYSLVASRRGIPVAGLIPHIGRLDIRRLADLYVTHRINYLVMDFDDKNPLALIGNINQTRALVRRIESESGSPCFLHGLNVPFYRGMWKDPILMARDVLLFGLGFNCYGSSHVFRPWRPMSKDVLERIKNSPKRFRLFNRQDYGYYRDDVVRPEELEEREPVAMKLSDVRTAGDRKTTRAFESAFNAERQGLEVDEIRSKLIDGARLTRHFAAKRQLSPLVMEKLFAPPR